MQSRGHGIRIFSSGNVSGWKRAQWTDGIKHNPAAAMLLLGCGSKLAFVLQAQPDSCLIVLAARPNLPWGRDERLLQLVGRIVYRPTRPVLAPLLRTTCLSGTPDHS